MIPPWQVDRESVRVKVTREMDEDELIHILMLKGYTRKVCALIRVLCIGIDLWVALWPLLGVKETLHEKTQKAQEKRAQEIGKQLIEQLELLKQ